MRCKSAHPPQQNELAHKGFRGLPPIEVCTTVPCVDLNYLFAKTLISLTTPSTGPTNLNRSGQAANKSNFNASLIHPSVVNPKVSSFNYFA